MRRITLLVLLMLGLTAGATAAGAQQAQSPAPAMTAQQQASRDATREKLRALLAVAGPRINVAFAQSTKNPYNFVGSMTQGLASSASLEIVISVTKNETIGFRIYPHYADGYINLDKAKNGPALMRQLLLFSDDNFLFWGADTTGDIFAGYTFTLESGFPDAAINVVLSSIRNQDAFVGQMKPQIDGSPAPQ